MRRVRRRVGLFMLGSLACAFLAALLWLPAGPHDIELGARLEAPSARHWLGTDHLGRDIAARVLAGAGPSFAAVALVLAGSLLLGSLAAAGMVLGSPVLAGLLHWLANSALALPTMVLALILAALFGPGPVTLAAALVVTAWAPYALTISALFRRISGEEYWRASIALGVRPRDAVVRHLLPNAAPAIAALAGADAGRAVIFASSLGFFGLSSDTGRPEWGAMIHEYRMFLFSDPRMVLAPLCAVATLSLALHLAFDPE